MSIIHIEQEFAIIDEQQFYQRVFQKINLKIRPELFEIHSKFMPDSQFDAIKKRGPTTKTKRKRRHEEAEISEDVRKIQEIAGKVQKIGEESGFFKKIEELVDNNKKARSAAAEALAVKSSAKIQEFQGADNLINLTDRWIKNSGDVPAILEDEEGVKFYIPSGATFHSGDVADIEIFSADNEIQFDLVVADPPWFCRSVKRKKTYEMSESALDNLDLPSFTSPDVLVAFWITNRSGIEEELENRLENWGMEVIASWKWLKVTTEGVPVYDFHKEKHKVPFEKIIFAVKKQKNPGNLDLANFPREFVFASVPMAIHSHKPPIYDLLHHFGVKFERPLELFARSLLPDTVSVGFEPILLNSQHVFEPKI